MCSHSLVADDGGVRGTDWNGIEQNVLRDRTASEGVQCRELVLGEGGRERGREGEGCVLGQRARTQNGKWLIH